MGSRFLSFALSLLLTAGVCLAEEKADPIVGRWRWIEDQVVECRVDKTFSVKPSNRHGTWKRVEASTVERKYELTWDDGVYTDTLMMSRDEKKLAGKNQKGKRVEATRLP